MNTSITLVRISAVIWLFLAACSTEVDDDKALAERDTVRDTVFVDRAANVDTTEFLDPMALPVTLPVLDAFFQDSAFAAALRDSLQLNEQQIAELRRAAREHAMRVGSDSAVADTMMTPGTMGARMYALQRISAIIGPAKTHQLGSLVRTRWEGTGIAGVAMGAQPNTVPTDTRIVVNAPSFRMDLFENGQLVRSYPIASGYPEFPLPSGIRQAREIIFNPSWTPPDEPWVESGSKDVKVGQRVGPGSKNNPLGIMKIPIGGPSLIHGGKSQAQIGGFGSHGCAGLTNENAREFSRLLAEVTGTTLDDKTIAEYGKNRTESKTVQLAKPIPVELRYETIVAQDGALYFYPDVYDRGANTEQNLRAVLQANGLTLEQLTEQERTRVMDALAKMGGARSDSARAAGDTASASAATAARAKTGTVTRSLKGPKEIVVPIAALKGKGYPKAVKVAKRTPTVKSDTTA